MGYALVSVDYVSNQLEEELDQTQALKCAQLIDEVSEDIHDTTGVDFLDPNEFPDGVPKGIQGVCARAVIRGLLSDPSNLVSEQVGDVVETYGGMLDYPPGDAKKLARYGGGQESWTLESECGP